VLPDPFKITDLYGDLNGARYRAQEYALARPRVSHRIAAHVEPVTPADLWGHVGAASGALQIALAASYASKGYARGPIALIWTSDDEGERAGALLQLPRGATPATHAKQLTTKNATLTNGL